MGVSVIDGILFLEFVCLAFVLPCLHILMEVKTRSLELRLDALERQIEEDDDELY